MDELRKGRTRGEAGRARGISPALLLLAVLVAVPAGAAERFGLVGTVDRAAQTVAIDGVVYSVDDDTEIRDREGKALSFSAFPVPGALEVVAVYYEAEGGRLRSLRLTEMPK